MKHRVIGQNSSIYSFCFLAQDGEVEAFSIREVLKAFYKIYIYILFFHYMQSLLRRMQFPLVQRSRIIEAMWNCGFCFGSICFMKSSTMQILSFAPHGEQRITYRELGLALHKSFYFHQTGIDILCYGAWIKGCANLLFASFVLNPYQQK